MAQGTSRTQDENASGQSPQQQEGQRQQQYGQSQQGGQQQQLSPGQQQMGGQQGSSMPVQQQGGLARFGRHPFAMMDQMMREMDELFGSFFGMPASYRRPTSQSMQNLWIPEVEMCEQDNQLKVFVDLPGLSKDDVKVDVENGVLVVQGERREERSEGGEGQGFRRTERRYGSFYRAIPLPENVDTENAQAQMKDGVLEVTFPTTGRSQGKRLEIKT